MSSSNPAAEPKEIAGRFQVVQKLGAGAFGTVYKARDRVLGRMLAIKTIRMEGLAASQAGLGEMLDRFKREAQVAAQLKHPNIVTIYDIGESEGLSYISMEFIDGIGLDHVISEAGRLPLERAAALAAQVADALDFAHRHGVVHRDIKPANIMIEPGDRVKVTDFGIAKPTDSAEHLTMTGSLLGTPSYMSPEQARGSAVDGRSDLFSLGCVIYEMVAGRKAFRGESITALLFKIITEEPPPIRQAEPSVPDAFVGILAKALAKAPESRYQNGRELADDLLALTRPGSVPTLRALDVPTLPGEAAAAELPALEVSATEPTRSSAPTAARRTTSTQPGGPPPLPPTILTPATATAARPAGATVRAGAPAAGPAAAASRAPQPAPAKRGGGLRLLVVLAAVAVVAIAAVGLGAWAFLARRTATTTVASLPAGSNPTPAPLADASAAPASVSTSMPAESGPALPIAESNPAAEPAASPAPGPRSAAATTPPVRPGRPAASAGAATQAPATGPGQSAPATQRDFSYLDEIPSERPDGRELGKTLSGKYQSGGSSGIADRRFNARPRFPRDLAQAERPAVAMLMRLLNWEEAYKQANGRYGSLRELQGAGLLNLDVPISGGAFQRARYRFQLSGDANGFKATATPLAVGRPFVVDDSGFVLVDE